MASLPHYWYSPAFHFWTFLFLPFSWLFSLLVMVRRKLYRSGLFKSQRFSVPVIVVGNIAVGGTGKTPLVIEIANFLRSQGYRPGIVSRGYGGKKRTHPHWVRPNDEASEVGDEAILLAKHTNSPLVVCPDRVAAVRFLLQKTPCNIVISDDGLQHYRLARDIEVAVVDGLRRFGNATLLPAGPLREPLSRLQSVDFIVVNEGQPSDEFIMRFSPSQFISLQTGKTIPWDEFPRQSIHAIAGIGHPERFFMSLREAGFELHAHVFADHYSYTQKDLDFADSLPIIMTEKDAVKCLDFADGRYWYVAITVNISEGFKEKLLKMLKSLEVKDDSESDFTKPSCRIARGVQQCDIRKRD